MEKKYIQNIRLAIAAVTLLLLTLTGCGKQETNATTEKNASLAGTIWTADYVITDGCKVTVEEAIQEGLLEEGRSFVLEFTVDSHCSFSRVYNGHVIFSDDFQYTFESGVLEIIDTSVTSVSFDSEDGILLTQQDGDNEATYHFVESENVEIHDYTESPTNPTI